MSLIVKLKKICFNMCKIKQNKKKSINKQEKLEKKQSNWEYFKFKNKFCFLTEQPIDIY